MVEHLPTALPPAPPVAVAASARNQQGQEGTGHMEKVGFGDRGDDSGRFHAGVSRHPVGRPNYSYSM